MRISTDTLIAAVCDTSDKVITKHFSQTILLYTIESSNLQRSHQVKCHQVQEKCHQVQQKSHQVREGTKTVS